METSVSLLERLCDPCGKAAWSRLEGLYRPLVWHWLARSGTGPPQEECPLAQLQDDDAVNIT